MKFHCSIPVCPFLTVMVNHCKYEQEAAFCICEQQRCSSAVHLPRLISTLVLHCLDSKNISSFNIQIPSLCLVALAGLPLTWSEIWKTSFLAMRFISHNDSQSKKGSPSNFAKTVQSTKTYTPIFWEVCHLFLQRDQNKKVIFKQNVSGITDSLLKILKTYINQRTNGPVNAHLISWPSKAQNIQNLENIW